MHTEKTVNRLVQEILKYTKPLSIWLFGSAVEGRMTENSDIDLLIVVPEGTPKRKTAQTLYLNITGFGRPFDIIVATEKELESFKENIGLIYKDVLEKGEKIYAG